MIWVSLDGFSDFPMQHFGFRTHPESNEMCEKKLRKVELDQHDIWSWNPVLYCATFVFQMLPLSKIASPLAFKLLVTWQKHSIKPRGFVIKHSNFVLFSLQGLRFPSIRLMVSYNYFVQHVCLLFHVMSWCGRWHSWQHQRQWMRQEHACAETRTGPLAHFSQLMPVPAKQTFPLHWRKDVPTKDLPTSRDIYIYISTHTYIYIHINTYIYKYNL